MKNRINNEVTILTIMIKIFCLGHKHASNDICQNCNELLTYSVNKTKKCIFKEYKPTCRKCTTHCYNEIQRDLIKNVMRYSGIRMLIKYPFLTIQHLLRELF